MKNNVGEHLRPPTLVIAAMLSLAAPDRTQCDCECRENQKDGYSIAHGRTRSAQRTNATPNTTDAIAIHCVIIFASSWL